MGLERSAGLLYALVLLAVCCMPILAADYDEYYNGKRIGSEYCSRMPDRGGQVYTAVYKPGKEDKLQFAAIGDWGWKMSVESTKLVKDGGLDTFGYCNYAGFGFSGIRDASGARKQVNLAKQMDKVAANYDWKFIVNTGDNFYQCGAESFSRFKTDWADIYQSRQTPNLRGLKWYNVIGNHDVAERCSVQRQILYSDLDDRWVFPSRYYAVDFYPKSSGGRRLKQDVAAAAVVDDVKVAVQAAAEAAKDKENEGQVVSVAGGKPSGKPRLRAIFLNSSPMVSKYLASTVAKNDPKTLTGNKYRTDETVTWAVPPNLDKQVDFLQTALAESDADWTIVVNHHPIMGAADTGYGLTSADQPDQGTQDPGNLLSAKYNNQNVWSKVLAVLRDKKPVAYFNGHDHVLAWATDGGAADKTQYITTGAGGDVNVNDGCCQPSASTDNTANEGFNYCGQAFVSSTNAAGKTTKRGRPNVKYTNMNNTLCDAAMKNVDTTVGPNGFVHVEMTATELKVDFWSVPVSTDVDLSQAPNDTPARKEKTMKCTKGGSGFMCVEG